MRTIYLAVLLFCFSTISHAQLELWTDYEVSDSVMVVTTVKVDSNMGPTYLEGLASGWVSSMETLVKLGQMESYSIMMSDLPESGDFNIVLVNTFANTADLAPNKAKYQAFMKDFTTKKAEESDEFARKNYPAIREITGSYMLREVKFLK